MNDSIINKIYRERQSRVHVIHKICGEALKMKTFSKKKFCMYVAKKKMCGDDEE